MKNLVYTIDGVWDFFIENSVLMCYNPVKEIYERVNECDCADFDTTVCHNNIVYVMTQNNNNFYISRYNGRWETECVLESNTHDSYYKNITLISNNNWLNAFYVLKHDEKYLLVHHILGGKVSPEVIAESGENICFSVSKDEKRNVYIVYSSNNTVFLRKYVWKNKSWTQEEKLTDSRENILNVSIGITGEFTPLFAYCTEEDENYRVYLNSEMITSGLQKEVFPCVVKNGNDYSCVFEYYGKMLVSYLENGQWQKIKYLHCDNFQKQERLKISGVKDFDENGNNFFYSYGVKSGGGYRTVCTESTSFRQYFQKLKNPENDDNVESFAGIKNNETKNISEEIKSIKRAVEKDDTSQILIGIANRLTNVENVLTKVVNIVNEINNKSKA